MTNISELIEYNVNKNKPKVNGKLKIQWQFYWKAPYFSHTFVMDTVAIACISHKTNNCTEGIPLEQKRWGQHNICKYPGIMEEIDLHIYSADWLRSAKALTKNGLYWIFRSGATVTTQMATRATRLSISS